MTLLIVPEEVPPVPVEPPVLVPDVALLYELVVVPPVPPVPPAGTGPRVPFTYIGPFVCSSKSRA